MDESGWAAILTAIGALILAAGQARKYAAEARALRRETEHLGAELRTDKGTGGGGNVREAIDRIESKLEETAGLASEAVDASHAVTAEQHETRREVRSIRAELRADREAVQHLREELAGLRDAVVTRWGPIRARWRR